MRRSSVIAANICRTTRNGLFVFMRRARCIWPHLDSAQCRLQSCGSMLECFGCRIGIAAVELELVSTKIVGTGWGSRTVLVCRWVICHSTQWKSRGRETCVVQFTAPYTKVAIILIAEHKNRIHYFGMGDDDEWKKKKNAKTQRKFENENGMTHWQTHSAVQIPRFQCKTLNKKKLPRSSSVARAERIIKCNNYCESRFANVRCCWVTDTCNNRRKYTRSMTHQRHATSCCRTTSRVQLEQWNTHSTCARRTFNQNQTKRFVRKWISV